jgi:PAS domain S-box-containing protein
VLPINPLELPMSSHAQIESQRPIADRVPPSGVTRLEQRIQQLEQQLAEYRQELQDLTAVAAANPAPPVIPPIPPADRRPLAMHGPVSVPASPQLLQMILDTMPQAVYWIDRDFKFRGANRIFLSDCGVESIDALIGKNDFEMPWRSQATNCRTADLRVLNDRVTITDYDEFLTKGDGSTAWVQSTKVPLINEADEVVGIFCCYEDVTERKRLQDAIHQIASGVSAKTGDSFFQSLAQYLGQVLGTEIVALAEIDEVTGRPETIATLLDGQFQETIKDTFHGTPCEQVLLTGAMCCFPSDLQRRFPTDQHVREWRAQSYLGIPLVNTANEQIGLIAVLSRSPLTNLEFAQEILRIFAVRVAAELERQSDLRKLQNLNQELENRVQQRTHALNESLGEKEVLLKEIHHRVKNNLQIISSLLRMQSRKLGQSTCIEGAFNDAQNRVRAMALIHEQLYRSIDLSKPQFDQYLQALTQNLLQTYRLGHRPVQAVFQLEPLQLNLNSAIPCGLIVNELVSNALKYAFPEPLEGQITITLATESDTIILLEIADDGCGLDRTINWRDTQSLGLQIVCSLVEQLQGEIRLVQDAGCQFQIRLPKSHVM